MRALLGLGSSLGDRRQRLRMAVATVRAHHAVELVAVSRPVWSRAVGPARGLFLNAVCVVDTALSPEELVSWAKTVERRLGRRPTARWHDRAIDIDVLLVGNNVVEGVDVCVPHPRMHTRRFVLDPCWSLQDARELWHPTLNSVLGELPRPEGSATWPAPGLGGRLAGCRPER